MEHSILLGQFISYKEDRQYSQHYIFFVTWELDQYERVFDIGKPLQQDVM
jgi:hypothetical protein